MSVLALVLLAVAIALVGGCVKSCSAARAEREAQEQKAAREAAAAKEAAKTKSVSFCAVGDNLANANILQIADGWSGTTGDGRYDFSPLYTKVKKPISKYDIRFINQETTLGGNDGFDYQGYPSYNTPDSMADAVDEAGFNVVNTNSNHTYDTWVKSIQHAQKVWAAHKNLTVIGSYASQSDREDVRVVKKNGLRIAFLSYSYGQNGYEQSDLPNDYYAVPWDEDSFKEDMARARKVSDFVVVYMHWGTEYSFEPSDEQKSIAQTLADNGVGLVIGSHVHVIQPMRWIDRSDQGAKAAGSKRMLCVYGLGDFVSGYTEPSCVLSGMFSCNIVRKDGKLSVKKIVWHPLIEHQQQKDGKTIDRVYFLRDYTKKMAEKNALLVDSDNPYNYLRNTTEKVIGDDFKIDM